MTGEQLRNIRESKPWTRDQMAKHLGGCTAQAVVKWERDERPIPQWVEEKLLRNIEVTLPLEDLAQLLNLAVKRNQPFNQMLAEVISTYLVTQQPNAGKAQALTPTPMDPATKVAEDAAVYKTSDCPGRQQKP
jgi:transcriptional regulator with XRE-family HTH domain